jgi:membrane protease subunit HflK
MIQNAFEQARGDIFKTLRESKTYAFNKATLAEATGRRFAGQLKAYRSAPEIYVREQWLSMYEQALKDIRKYIVLADPNDTQVTIVDLSESQTPDIYSGMEKIKENSEK